MPKRTPVEIEDHTPPMLFWTTSSQFMHASRKLGNDHLPARYLACHAIEMALKAHLRGKGYTLDHLRAIGHSISAALKAAQATGMKPPPKRVQRVLDFAEEINSKQEYRYPHLYRPKYITAQPLIMAGAWVLHEAARAVAAHDIVDRTARSNTLKAMRAGSNAMKKWATPRAVKKDPVFARLLRLLAQADANKAPST